MKGWCPACSNFAITNNSLQFAKEAGKLHLLVAFLRRLPSDAWTENFQEIDLRNIQSVLSQVAEPEILEQFDLALRFICEMCSEVGVPSTFDFKTDWPLLVAHSRRGAHYILRQLAETGYLRAPNGRLNPPRPTRKAYERLLEIRSSGHLSLNGFVAMSFSPDRDAVWKEIIKPAILAAGYRPVRVDQYEHNRRIDDEIIAQIKRCRFLVADFTRQKQGVYFEAGLALGLGRNVIWMCEESELTSLHFDTRQFNHIPYKHLEMADIKKARGALENRIVALEGQGTYTPDKSSPF